MWPHVRGRLLHSPLVLRRFASQQSRPPPLNTSAQYDAIMAGQNKAASASRPSPSSKRLVYAALGFGVGAASFLTFAEPVQNLLLDNQPAEIKRTQAHAAVYEAVESVLALQPFKEYALVADSNSAKNAAVVSADKTSKGAPLHFAAKPFRFREITPPVRLPAEIGRLFSFVAEAELLYQVEDDVAKKPVGAVVCKVETHGGRWVMTNVKVLDAEGDTILETERPTASS